MSPVPPPAPLHERRAVFLAALEYGVHPLIVHDAVASAALDRDDEHRTHSTPTTTREGTP